MFQWKEIDQEEKLAVEEAFPLNTVYFPMRMVIFETMKMDQVVKMAFESLEAARDIRSAQIQPKVLKINVGDLQDRSVVFDLDGYSCTVGTKRALEGKDVNEKFFSTKTFSGEMLDECTTDKTGIFIIVPGEGDLLDCVSNVYKFLCSLFQEALTTNLVVSGEFAYLYPVINSIRKIKSLNRLELCGHWGSEEHLKEVFDDILETTKFNYLGIHDEPPVRSKPHKITADRVLFHLHDPWWLSVARFQAIDAKKITLQNSGTSLAFAERFNFALKSWREGTGMQRLESITCYEFNSAQLGTVKERLPFRQWNKYTRPGCYYVYKTGENDEKEFFDFHDLRNAEDLTSLKEGLGTIFGASRMLMFLVWTEKEVQSVKEAYGQIEIARQKHINDKSVMERKLIELEQENEEYSREMQFARTQNRRVSAVRNREMYYHQKRIEDMRSKLRNKTRAIQDCDRFKEIIENHSD